MTRGWEQRVIPVYEIPPALPGDHYFIYSKNRTAEGLERALRKQSEQGDLKKEGSIRRNNEVL